MPKIQIGIQYNDKAPEVLYDQTEASSAARVIGVIHGELVATDEPGVWEVATWPEGTDYLAYDTDDVNDGDTISFIATRIG